MTGRLWAFYAHVEHDRLLRPVYPASLHCAVDSLARFLIQFSGVPSEYSRARSWLSLREAHAGFRIGPAEREAWLRNMAGALDELSIPPAAREFFERSSAFLVNHGQVEEPAPSACPEHLWDAQRTVDEIVACVRAGDGIRPLRLRRRRSCSRTSPGIARRSYTSWR